MPDNPVNRQIGHAEYVWQLEQQRIREYQEYRRNLLLYGQAQMAQPPQLWLWGAGQAQQPGQMQGVPQPVPPEDQNMKLLNPFLIGCDPEFVACNAAGERINVKASFQQKGLIGWDHNGDVIEIRPEPAKSSYTLLKRIWEAVKSVPIQKAKYRAGAYIEFPDKKVTLGGHVHLDLPFEDTYDTRYRVMALDELTLLFEHLDILPTEECAKRRLEGKQIAGLHEYGKLGDVRRADNANRTEYRTMASWLYSPITTYLCLTAAKLAAFAPKETVIQLGQGAPSTGKVARFFENFAQKDDDARRVVECVLEPGLRLQRDPGAHILESWKRELKELEAA